MNDTITTPEYDEEFGPNKTRICPNCKTRLLDEEICWCVDRKEEDDDN